MHRLAESGNLTFTFTSFGCMVQDEKNSNPIAMGKVEKQLYWLNKADAYGLGSS